MEKKIPFKKAFIWILLVTLVISGSALFFTLCYFQVKDLRKSHTGFNIATIDHNEKALSTNYLAYLLDLSVDKPTNLYQFDISLAKKRLLSSAVIENFGLKKSPPNAIAIEYALRKPFAKVADFTNTAIDRERNYFPLEPFFKSLNLLEIVLGIEESSIKWGEKADKKRVDIAFDIFDVLKKEANVRRIDLSKIEADSLGQREIVVIIQERNDMFNMLRLAPNNYQKQLSNFIQLKNSGSNSAKYEGAQIEIIDLRISDLAFINDL